MIRRLLLALLVLCLALPATAAPMQPAIGGATVAAMAEHGDCEQGERGTAAGRDAATHQCIGCAVPMSGGALIPVPALSASPEPAYAPPPLARALSGPDTPPPRA